MKAPSGKITLGEEEGKKGEQTKKLPKEFTESNLAGETTEGLDDMVE